MGLGQGSTGEHQEAQEQAGPAISPKRAALHKRASRAKPPSPPGALSPSSRRPSAASGPEFAPLLGWFQDLERAHERLVDAHHGPRVVKLSAVVGRREDGHQLALGEELVPVLHHLVRPAHQVQVVFLQELGHAVRAERVRHAAVVLAPPLDVLVRVGPEEVAEEARVGHVGRPGHLFDLVEGLELGGEPPVHAEDLLVDEGGDGEAVEAVGEGLPEADVVAPLALVVEPIDAVDRGALVVAAEQEEVLGVLDLKGGGGRRGGSR